jgi:hypothetical protein
MNNYRNQHKHFRKFLLDLAKSNECAIKIKNGYEIDSRIYFFKIYTNKENVLFNNTIINLTVSLNYSYFRNIDKYIKINIYDHQMEKIDINYCRSLISTNKFNL